jgi:hypothetical protein
VSAGDGILCEMLSENEQMSEWSARLNHPRASQPASQSEWNDKLNEISMFHKHDDRRKFLSRYLHTVCVLFLLKMCRLTMKQLIISLPLTESACLNIETCFFNIYKIVFTLNVVCICFQLIKLMLFSFISLSFAECHFGKELKELGTTWFPDLGAPFGKMYCIKCQCIPVSLICTIIVLNSSFPKMLIFHCLMHKCT